MEAGEEVEDVGVLAVFGFGDLLEGELGLADGGVGGFEDGGDEVADCFVVEMGLLGVGEELLERWESGEEGLDIVRGFPAGEDFEGTEGDGDFGLVVVVGELLRILRMQSFGEVFVWVDLKGQCLCN